MSDYQTYLERIHGETKTPDELITDTIKEATGKIPQTTIRIVAGEANEVYDIALSNQRNVILRINRDDYPAFQKERWAIDQVRKVGVPAPEILLIKEIPLGNDQVMSLFVQNKIEGEPLERGKIDFETLDPKLQQRYLNQAGEILSRIHSIPVSGFGYLNGSGQGEYPSFTELVSEHLDQEGIYIPLTDKFNIPRQLMIKVFDTLRKLADLKPNIPPVLNHNDFNPKHIIVANDQVVGIIDWGEVYGSSPVNDFSNWQFWYPDYPIEWLKEGYSNKSIFNDEFEMMTNWIQLHARLGTFWWYSQSNYLPGVDQAVKGLKASIAYFEQHPPS